MNLSLDFTHFSIILMRHPKPRGVIGDNGISTIMKYDLTKHALIEDNGDLIATLNSCISAGKAFEMIDYFNMGYKELLDDKEGDSDYLEGELKETEQKLEDVEDELDDEKNKVKKLNTDLDDIYRVDNR